MPNYALSNANGGTLQATTTTFNSLITATAATTALRRGKIYDVMFGTLGTPADLTYQFDISRATALGTGTTVTALPLDPADGVASTVGTANNPNGTPPTITATSSLFNLGINQRASYRWVAAPGSEMVWPATNLSGLSLRTLSASGTATATGQLLVSE